MLRDSRTAGQSTRLLLQQNEFERLFRGQQRLEKGLEDVLRCIERVAEKLPQEGYTSTNCGCSTQGPERSRAGSREDDVDPGSIIHMQQSRHSLSPQAKREISFSDGVGSRWRDKSFTSVSQVCRARPQFHDMATALRQSHFAGFTTSSTMHAQPSVIENEWSTTNVAHVPARRGVHPASKVTTTLDVCRILFLLLDVIMVPYVIAWDLQMTGSLYYMSWIVVCFWTCDLIMNFNTGFIINSNIVIHRSAIARWYLRRWFFLDLAVLLVDFTEVLAASLGSDRTSPSVLRLFRVVRLFKMTRLVRIVVKLRTGLLARIHTAVLQTMQSNGLTSYHSVFTGCLALLQLLFLIVWLGHIGACLWWGLRRIRSEESATPDEMEADSWEVLPSYLRALYWSMSTMVAGSPPVPPSATWEAILAVCWIIVGAAFVTAITSSLAAMLIESQSARQEIMKRMQILASFLAQLSTPSFLSWAVHADFNRKAFEQQPLTEADLPFLQTIAPNLRAALREHQYKPYFLLNPLCRIAATMHPPLVQKVCHKASSPALIDKGHEIFAVKQEMEHAVLLTKGVVAYRHVVAGPRHATDSDPPSSLSPVKTTGPKSPNGASANGETGERMCSMPQWICELALIIHWKTLGSLLGAGRSELLLVSSEEFIRIVLEVPDVGAFVAVCASEYARRVQSLIEMQSDVLSDFDPVIDCDEIVATMPLSMRTPLVSNPVLENLRRNQKILSGLLHKKSLEDLEAEVDEGKCHLVMDLDAQGVVSRVVRLAVLELVNFDGLLCVQLAQSQFGITSPDFKLPGCKIRGDETPDEAIERLLVEQFPPSVASLVVMLGSTVVTDSSASVSYGIRTKYIKTIYKAELRGFLEPVDPDLVAPRPTTHRRSNVSNVSMFSWRVPGLWRQISVSGFTSSVAGHLFNHVWGRGTTTTDDSPERSHNIEKDVVVHTLLSRPLEDLAFAAQKTTDHNTHSPSVPQEAYIYRWLTPAQFEALTTSREDTEASLRHHLKSLDEDQWHRLLAGWAISPSSGAARNGNTLLSTLTDALSSKTLRL